MLGSTRTLLGSAVESVVIAAASASEEHREEMTAVLIVMAGPILLWALCHQRLQRLSVTGPLLMVAAGAVVGWFITDETTVFFDSKLALQLAEAILAMLLFVDAVELRGSLRSHASKIPVRLLAVALPLSLILIVSVGLALPLGLSVVAVLAITCIAVPVDFSPELSIIRDRRIPERVRQWLAVESGYNDGLVTPFLLAAIALATTSGDPGDHALDAFGKAAPAGIIAVAVGAVVGFATGWLFRQADRRGWTDTHGTRVGIVALPLFTFAVALAVHGNGFVAAFVCGVAFRIALAAKSDPDSHEPPAQFSFAQDIAGLVNLILWLSFGIVGVIVVVGNFDWWSALFLAAFVITIGRIVPVLISLLGTETDRRDRVFMAVMGPRGVASIVFGLIAYNALPNADGEAVLAATCIIVLSSLLLHGLGAPLIIRRLYGATRSTRPDADRHAGE